MRKYSTVWAEHEGVRRDDAGLAAAGDEAVVGEVLRVDHRVVDIGEDLELVGHAGVVAVGGQAEGDHALAPLRLDEGLDHAVLGRHAADPVVGHDGHGGGPSGWRDRTAPLGTRGRGRPGIGRPLSPAARQRQPEPRLVASTWSLGPCGLPLGRVRLARAAPPAPGPGPSACGGWRATPRPAAPRARLWGPGFRAGGSGGCAMRPGIAGRRPRRQRLTRC